MTLRYEYTHLYDEYQAGWCVYRRKCVPEPRHWVIYMGPFADMDKARAKAEWLNRNETLGSTEVVSAGSEAQEFILLHTLPAGHEQRRKKLVGAQCRNLHSKDWRDIRLSWAIAGASYDDLGEAWTRTTEFRSKTPNVGTNRPWPQQEQR